MVRVQSLSALLNAWKKIPILFRSILSGLLVSSVGVASWQIILGIVPAPWSMIPMAGVLLVYYRIFSGSWRLGKKKNPSFRATSLSSRTWQWSLPAGLLFVGVVQASFAVTFRFIEFPHAKFTADYHALGRMPIMVAWAMLIMSSIVAAICEETGFRGYMQVPLENKYGPVVGIAITSIAFTAVHLGHSWTFPILPHIFLASCLLGILAYKTNSLLPGIIGHCILDIFNYSIWWTDLTGGFTEKTIAKTGVDSHFVFFTLVFLIASGGFFFLIPSRRNNQAANAI